MRIFVLIATLLTLGTPVLAGAPGPSSLPVATGYSVHGSDDPLPQCGHPAGCHER